MLALERMIGSFFIIITVVAVENKEISLNIETTSDSFQFVGLENLIGSVHRYAPQNIYTFVRDMGLSKSQRMLLGLYQNVRVIPAAGIISAKTQYVEVDEALVVIDGKYSQQKHYGKLLYIDSIRKRFQLAIVIPFIRSQLYNLVLQLNLSTIYTPCSQPSDAIDLIFYHNEGKHSSLETDIRQIKFARNCYRNIRYLAVNLSRSENQYPLGSFLMWKKLLVEDDNSSASLRTYGYTHFFLMEPDTRPIRRFWLDAITDQIKNGKCQELYFSTNWWMTGSIYRGSKQIGYRFLHINGNALYHLSTSFISYIEHFSRFYLTEQNLRTGYDLVIFSLMLDHQDLGQQFWHKFRFSEFIQNCWHTGCNGSDELNNTEFILNNPETYLIHGSFVEEQSNQYRTKDTRIIPVIFVLLTIAILWHYRGLYRVAKLRRIMIPFLLYRKMIGT